MTTYTFKQLCDVVHGGLTEMFKPDSIGVEQFSKYHIHFFTRCFSVVLRACFTSENKLGIQVQFLKYNIRCAFPLHIPLQEKAVVQILETAYRLKD